MGKNPDLIEQEIRAKRDAISGRVEEMRQRGADDIEEVTSGIKETFEGGGIKDQVEKRPFTVLAGALGLGVALGLASETVNLRAIAGGDRDQPTRGRKSGGSEGLFAGLTSAFEYAAVDEGGSSCTSGSAAYGPAAMAQATADGATARPCSMSARTAAAPGTRKAPTPANSRRTSSRSASLGEPAAHYSTRPIILSPVTSQPLRESAESPGSSLLSPITK
jgi:hypothetical protein